jgi:hypothetical protein
MMEQWNVGVKKGVEFIDILAESSELQDLTQPLAGLNF